MPVVTQIQDHVKHFKDATSYMTTYWGFFKCLQHNLYEREQISYDVFLGNIKYIIVLVDYTFMEAFEPKTSWIPQIPYEVTYAKINSYATMFRLV